MKAKWLLVPLSFLALSGCTGLPIGVVSIDINYVPAKVDVTRTDVFDKDTGAFLGSRIGYLKTSPLGKFAGRSGSLGVFLETARLQIKDGAGNPISPGFDRETQSVGVRVAPGLVCPANLQPCVLGAKDTTFGTGPTTSTALNFLDKPVTDQIAGEVAGLALPETRQYRVGVTYTGVDANLRQVEIPSQDLTIEVSLQVTREEQ
jgi:hypothetical protein